MGSLGVKFTYFTNKLYESLNIWFWNIEKTIGPAIRIWFPLAWAALTLREGILERKKIYSDKNLGIEKAEIMVKLKIRIRIFFLVFFFKECSQIAFYYPFVDMEKAVTI